MTTRIEAANWLAAVGDIERRYKAHKLRIQKALDSVTAQARKDKEEAVLALKHIQKTLNSEIPWA